MTNKPRTALESLTTSLTQQIAFRSAVDKRKAVLLDELAELLYGVQCVLERLDTAEYNAITNHRINRKETER